MEKGDIPKQEIEKRAYELYLECGGGGGHELEHWYAAEEELQLEYAKKPTPLKQKTVAAGQHVNAGSSERTGL